MGYYTGNGFVKGGGETIRTLKSLWWYGAHSLRQKTVFQTVCKPGVSYNTAIGAHADVNLRPVGDGSDDLAWVIYDAVGTRTTPTYSQIGDSNLYELNVTTETLTVCYASGTTVNPSESQWRP